MRNKLVSLALYFFIMTTTLNAQSLLPPFINSDSIITLADNCSYNIISYQKCAGNLVIEKGIITRNMYVPCTVTIEKGRYVFKLGRDSSSHHPIFLLNCGDGFPNKPFNGRKMGHRVGIWFKKYPWGTVRKATMYKGGKPFREVFFRPNGHLLRYVREGEVSKRLSEYDKKGRVQGALPKF